MKKFLASIGSIGLMLAAAPAYAGGRWIEASVYDDWYNGRHQYCGGRYDHWGISAAHPWLPCNTRVRVTLRGRSLTVPIRDRCDCGRIDLSGGAAYRLGMGPYDLRRVRISY